MKAREKARIQATIDELKAMADELDGVESTADRENLLNRADALEWVLSIAE